MADDHGKCPRCETDLNGGYIWQHFYEKVQTEGYWGDVNGNYTSNLRILDAKEAAVVADKIAKNYGADRTKGRWGLAIGIYSVDTDRTVSWQCPFCEHEWPR